MFGALEIIPLRLKDNLRAFCVGNLIELIHRSALLKTAKIHWKGLEM